MKYKAKPIARLEIRERVERKFRARGALYFHGLVFLLGTALLLYNLPTIWESRIVRYDESLVTAVTLYGLLTLSVTLHFIRYHYKFGRGYLQHEAETAARINRDLRRAGPAEAEERETLIEVEQEDKLKNKRGLWQHASFFVGLSSIMMLVRWTEMLRYNWIGTEAFVEVLYIIGAWGIALIAHALRYYFTYASSGEKRQAKIDAEVAREMAALGLSSAGSARGKSPAGEQSLLAEPEFADEIDGRARRSRS